MPKRLSQLFAFKKMLSQKLSDTCLCQLRNCRVVKAMRYIIYAETMHDKWKQTPYPIWFLRRCDSKSSKVAEPLPKRNKNTGQVPRRTGVSLQFFVKPSTTVYHRNFT